MAEGAGRRVGIDPEARREIFGNAAVDVAGYVANGLAKVLAADGLWEIAQAHGLVAAFGADAIQADIAEAFKNIDRVPDESDKSNGKDPPPRRPRLTPPFICCQPRRSFPSEPGFTAPITCAVRLPRRLPRVGSVKPRSRSMRP